MQMSSFSSAKTWMEPNNKWEYCGWRKKGITTRNTQSWSMMKKKKILLVENEHILQVQNKKKKNNNWEKGKDKKINKLKNTMQTIFFISAFPCTTVVLLICGVQVFCVAMTSTTMFTWTTRIAFYVKHYLRNAVLRAISIHVGLQPLGRYTVSYGSSAQKPQGNTQPSGCILHITQPVHRTYGHFACELNTSGARM